MNMQSRFFPAVFATLLLAGCATETAMRQVAGASAELVNDFKHGTQAFVVRMNALNDADAARLRRLSAQTQAMQIRSATAQTAWSAIGDDDAVAMYDALTARQPADVVTGSAVLRSLQVASDDTPITADAKQFDSLVQKLNALAAAPSFEELAKSWLAFGKQVNDTLQEEMKASANALAATSKKADATNVAKPK